MMPMDKRQEFKQLVPNAEFIDSSDLEGLEHYLSNQSFLQSEESILACEIPGTGNMNHVIRVKTNRRQFIIKQSRPWVEKYPAIPAPIERIHNEATFYENVSFNLFLQSSSPDIYIVDHKNYVIVMEDLGDVQDFSFLYSGESQISKTQLEFLAHYLTELHQLKIQDFPDNLDMRLLNYEHIFKIPFTIDNGINLEHIQSGLQILANQIIKDKPLKDRILDLGELYLNKGNTLIHGDFYPGSWMQGDQLFILDPEFCFLGFPEFDLAVACAHLKLANQPDETIQYFLSSYQDSLHVNERILFPLIGVEILRRLLGVAQLPLSLDIAEKKQLIEKSTDWILS